MFFFFFFFVFSLPTDENTLCRVHFLSFSVPFCSPWMNGTRQTETISVKRGGGHVFCTIGTIDRSCEVDRTRMTKVAVVNIFAVSFRKWKRQESNRSSVPRLLRPHPHVRNSISFRIETISLPTSNIGLGDVQDCEICNLRAIERSN